MFLNGGVGGAIRNLVTQVSIFVIIINLININTVFAKETTKTYQLEYLQQLELLFYHKIALTY